MRYGGSTFRSLAACGLAALWLACGATANAQGMRTSGSSLGGGSSFGGGGSSFGGGGGSGGGSSLGSSNGFGNSGNGTFSFSGGQSFVGGSSQSFVGGSGSSFTGSSGGSSFTGNSSSFMGSSGTGGYSGLGSGGLRGGTSNGVSTMNPFRSSFGNVLAAGLGNSTALGQPLYSNLTTNSTNLVGGSMSGVGGMGMVGNRGGLGGTGSMGSAANQTGGSFGALGVIAGSNNVVIPLPPGAPPGSASPALPAVGPAANPAVRLSALPAPMQQDLQGLVARSNVSPATRSALKFGLDSNGTVVLQGTAASPAEARTIESLVRFAPGVRGVRNEMTWKQ
jgi:hypothetical protein